MSIIPDEVEEIMDEEETYSQIASEYVNKTKQVLEDIFKKESGIRLFFEIGHPAKYNQGVFAVIHEGDGNVISDGIHRRALVWLPVKNTVPYRTMLMHIFNALDTSFFVYDSSISHTSRDTYCANVFITGKR